MLQPDPNGRPESMSTVATWRPAVASSTASQPGSRTLASRKWTVAVLLTMLAIFLVGGAYYLFSDSSSPPAERLTAHAPVLNPDTGIDARRAEDARLAADSLTRQRAEEAKVAAEKTRNDYAKLSAPERPSSDPVERIQQFVNSYDGGECFFVEPVAVAGGNTTLEGYGRSAAPFEALDSDFKRANGFEALVGYHMVTPQQCAAISFVGQLRSRDSAPRLDVSAGNLRSSGYVSGIVTGFGNRNIELLMVDHEGNVMSLTSQLKGDGDERSFTINVQRGDAGPSKLQLLLALATTKPFESLRPAQPGSLDLGPADKLFPHVYDEGLKSGQSIAARIKSFNLEK
jgi:serine/threonine-protein kinase